MSDILDQFHEEDLPPSHVDIQAAVRSGRRRRRGRTGFAAVGVAAIVVAGAVTAPQWLALRPGPAPEPGAALPTCSAPIPSLSPPAATTYFDVLRYQLDPSGVTGFSLASYATSPESQIAELVNSAGDRTVTVRVYPAGGQPLYRLHGDRGDEPIDPAAGEPAPPVNGMAAFWLPQQDRYVFGYGQGLAWQWAPGAWVLVTAEDTTGGARPNGNPVADETLRALAAQVAPQLDLGVDRPVTSPFAMPVLDCTRLVGTSVMFDSDATGTPFARFGLLFATANDDTVSVIAHSGATPDDKPGSATSTVDGHPAYEGSLLVVYGVDGFAFEVTNGTTGWDRASIWRTAEVHPGATFDPATWGPPIR